MQRLVSKLIDIFGKRIRRVREAHTPAGTVCYYPPFPCRDALTNHYYRACWYLPRVNGLCDRVLMFQTFEDGPGEPGPTPSHMAPPPSRPSHILIQPGWRANLRALLRSRLILIWKATPWSRCIAAARVLGFSVVNVDTDDPLGFEHHNYCFVLWRDLLPQADKSRILADNRRRFGEIAARIAEKGYRKACVLGTGPSLNEALDLDFEGTLTIICNSIVKDSRLLQHTRPCFLVAADVVSHFGVSLYAQQFRSDLLAVLGEQDVVFVTVASVGYLFLCHYPNTADRVISIEHAGDAPNYNLLEDFRAPMMDSVLNILMLPLAATFCKEIHILGCDGKATDSGNEDFWPHAAASQYHHLVDTGHRCHPTFDVQRRMRTYQCYERSVRQTILLGEREHEITYRCLAPSNVQTLNDRHISANEEHARRLRPKPSGDTQDPPTSDISKPPKGDVTPGR